MLTGFCFDLEGAPSLEPAELRQLSFDFLGFRYAAAPPEDAAPDEVLLLPRASSLLYRNSFVPEIRIRKEGSADRIRYHVRCRLLPAVRKLLCAFCILAGLLQLALLFRLAWTGDFSFSLFVPAILAAFGLLMTRGANAVIGKRLPQVLGEALALKR